MKSQEVEAALKEYEGEDAPTLWATFLYEKAFVFLMYADYRNAGIAFQLSGDKARESGSPFRGWIGDFLFARNQYYGGLWSASELRFQLHKLEQDFLGFPEPEEHDVGIRKSFEYTLRKSLSDAEYDSGGPDYISRAEAARSSELLRENVGRNLSYVLVEKQLVSRIHITRGEARKAAQLFASYLDVDEPALFAELGIHPEPELQAIVRNWPDHIVMDYRDFGKALLLAELPDAACHARAVWACGLELGCGANNFRFARDIRIEIDKLGIR